MLRKGHEDLYKAQTMEERKNERLRREEDQIKFADLRFERRQIVGVRKARRQVRSLTSVASHQSLSKQTGTNIERHYSLVYATGGLVVKHAES